ncbi:MAG: Lin0512 family protein [Sedimentibacter sp.]|uniref:Lin0512 family protein n=1 Tax=Sedimentibacter sp. TaxID=1960295 RepID=UPI00315813F5
MLKRYVVEIGVGTDMHGGDLTKAAVKAVKDATSRSCLCGIEDVLGKSPLGMHVHVKIGCSNPEKIDKETVLKAVPVGTGEIEVVQGGLGVRGLEVPAFGDGNTIEVVVAALTVYIEV